MLSDVLGGSSLVLGNIVPWAPKSKVYPVDAPLDTPPVVLLPGFGNCSADYEIHHGDPDDSMAAILRVGHQGPPCTNYSQSLVDPASTCAHVLLWSGLQHRRAKASMVLV